MLKNIIVNSKPEIGIFLLKTKSDDNAIKEMPRFCNDPTLYAEVPKQLISPFQIYVYHFQSRKYELAKCVIDPLGMYFIVYFPTITGSGSNNIICVDLSQACEVQTSRVIDTKSNNNLSSDTGKVNALSFAIVFGTSLSHKNLLYGITNSDKMFNLLITWFNVLINNNRMRNPSFELLVAREYYRLKFIYVCSGKTPISELLKSMNCGKNGEIVTSLLTKMQIIDQTGNINFEKMSITEFYNLFASLLDDLIQHIRLPLKNSDTIPFSYQSLSNFIEVNQNSQQGTLPYREDVEMIYNSVETNPRSISEQMLSASGLTTYIFSEYCSAINPVYHKGIQNMDQPLSHYFINSSHNTYLSGRQVNGTSSVDMYRYVLLTGCRCVEIDAWDGSDNSPIVTHGKSMCSDISLEETLKAIKETAFVVSDYPVILSIENHLSYTQQGVMANMMVEIFGDLLLSQPLSDYPLKEGVYLPPPERLKRKILIKNKKLKNEDEEIGLRQLVELNNVATVSDEYNIKNIEYKRNSMTSPENEPSTNIDNGICGNNLVYNHGSIEKNLICKKFDIDEKNEESNAKLERNSAFKKNNTFTKSQLSDMKTSEILKNAKKNSDQIYKNKQDIPLSNKKEKKNFITKIANAKFAILKQISKSEEKLTDEVKKTSPALVNAANKPRKHIQASDIVHLTNNISIDKEFEAIINQNLIGINERTQDAFDTSQHYDSVENDDFSSSNSFKSSSKSFPDVYAPSIDSDEDEEETFFEDTKKDEMGQTVVKIRHIHPYLSSLVNYIRPLRTIDFTKWAEDEYFLKVSSIAEMECLKRIKAWGKEISQYTQTRLIRVYPRGNRVDSTNYFPQQMWDCGMQLVALNFQTADSSYQLNSALFEINNRCGYVLKPSYVINNPMYDPHGPPEHDSLMNCRFQIKILGGLFITDNTKPDLYCSIETYGRFVENISKKVKSTHLYDSNKVYVSFENEMISFDCIVRNPYSFIRFAVIDKGVCHGQRIINIQEIRRGFRYITLRTQSQHQLPLAALFVHIKVMGVPKKTCTAKVVNTSSTN